MALTKEKIEEALDEIRPALFSHGGDVEVVEIKDGVVKVKLLGACQGCMMSQLTLKAGIEEMLKEKFPEIKEVVDINEEIDIFDL